MGEESLDDVLEELGLAAYVPAFWERGIFNVRMTCRLTEDDWAALVPDPSARSRVLLKCRERMAWEDARRPSADAPDAEPFLEADGACPAAQAARVAVLRRPSAQLLATHLHETCTDIPARLDRLPWCAWHWLVTAALGFAWVLDGFLVSLNSLVGPKLTGMRRGRGGGCVPRRSPGTSEPVLVPSGSWGRQGCPGAWDGVAFGLIPVQDSNSGPGGHVMQGGAD